MSHIGSVVTTYTKSDLPRFQVEVKHRELNKYQLIKGEDPRVVVARAKAKAAEWDEMWAKRAAAEARRGEREAAARDVESKKRLAAERTAEAGAALDALNNLLRHALAVNDAIEWESLKDTGPYPEPHPAPPTPPAVPVKCEPPSEPLETDEVFKPQIGFLDFFSGQRKQQRRDEAAEAFRSAHDSWQRAVDQIECDYQAAGATYWEQVKKNEETQATQVAAWQQAEADYLEQHRQANIALDERRALYESQDDQAITDYCRMVLDNSQYPEYFPKDYEVEYNPANKMLIVDYQLPTPAELPTTVEVKYVAARDEFAEKALAERQLNQLYDATLYQAALRTLHELFEADVVTALDAVTFNGWVKSVDRATGLDAEGCVVSIQVGRDEFTCLDLSNVDPKACFKKLKGVCAARLFSLTPVAPVLSMSREDKRFISSYDVADTIGDEDNLAAMPWDDFEHLIRELFEKEFATSGAEVKVTQASRDGGVDAVIFDPDPIHGGKTVVQAKRYTNTVGVSAVRDLYGTLMNEGANKGILVTTSDYGSDAYGFANGKPLVLLNGANLLHLLEKHGHKARIDLKEAKLLLGEAG